MGMTIVGLGDAGCRALVQIFSERLAGVHCVAANTHRANLDQITAHLRIVMGDHGAAGDIETGRRAAETHAPDFYAAFTGATHIFLIAGLGGGTGGGAAPVLAHIARDCGARVGAVVFLPFRFEGSARAESASKALEQLRNSTMPLIEVRGDRLLNLMPHPQMPDVTRAYDLAARAMAWQVLARLV